MHLGKHQGPHSKLGWLAAVQIVEANMLQYYWSALPGEGCDTFKQEVSNSLRPFGLQPSLAFPSQHLQMALLRGNHLYRQPILDIRTNTSGKNLMCVFQH